MRDTKERIQDMLEAIQRINKYAVRGKVAFSSDELIQTYVVHNLQILGEAAFKIPQKDRQENNQIPWVKIMGMRHILVHDYFQIDLEIVWNVVELDLPLLQQQLELML